MTWLPYDVRNINTICSYVQEDKSNQVSSYKGKECLSSHHKQHFITSWDCACPPAPYPSFELYQILTSQAKPRGLVCHRKGYLLTKDTIYDTIDTEPEIEQRNMYNTIRMLVNISEASCIQDRTEMFQSNLGFTRTDRFWI